MVQNPIHIHIIGFDELPLPCENYKTFVEKFWKYTVISSH